MHKTSSDKKKRGRLERAAAEPAPEPALEPAPELAPPPDATPDATTPTTLSPVVEPAVVPPHVEGPGEVDSTKIDPWLAEALEDRTDEDERSLSVFVRLDEEKADAHEELLRRIGLDPLSFEKRAPLTATLSPREVRELSLDPAVSDIRLSRKLKPL